MTTEKNTTRRTANSAAVSKMLMTRRVTHASSDYADEIPLHLDSILVLRSRRF